MLVGWILPSALNVAVFVFAVAPSLRTVPPVRQLWPSTQSGTGLLLLAASLLLGLVLSALQTWLYRLLEGYLLWPDLLYARACRRRTRAKHTLRDRLTLLRLQRREDEGQLAEGETAQLAALRADPRIRRAASRDHRASAIRRSLLRERLARYPVADGQIGPTRLANAIRRFEEYGYDRYRLDTQTMWHELTATAPEQARRKTELARANVDFFIALIYGHAAVAGTALLTLGSAEADPSVLLITAAVLGCLTPLWYRSAVAATDEWAAAVRALVNTGRKPLAESLGLVLPRDVEREREMWSLVTKMSRLPYHERAAALDAFRADPDQGAPCRCLSL
nr:hypothetical protein [Streptomyces coryli]